MAPHALSETASDAASRVSPVSRVSSASPVSSAPRAVASIAAALAEPERAGICTALMDGRAWTVGELARGTGLTPSETTVCVDDLIRRGVVVDLRQSRHRYVRLAGPEVARAIASLDAVAPAAVAAAHRRNTPRASESLRAGRTCYRHLAGRLGIALADGLHDTACLDARWSATSKGRELLRGWGVPQDVLASGSGCLDFSERRFHLAGRLGVAVCTALFAHGWVTRIDDSRAVRLTPVGSAALADAGLAVGAA